MHSHESTCWTVIHGAVRGDVVARDEVARHYCALIRKYFLHRWAGFRLRDQADDATQEAFLELFRDGGALERLDVDKARSFRAFLYGVIRNVAARFEERERTRKLQNAGSGIDKFQVDEQSLSEVFDRLWAQNLLREAVLRYEAMAEENDESSRRRVEILRLRFGSGMPIRDIAKKWDVDAARVHKEYAKARAEFRAVLMEVCSFFHTNSEQDMGSVMKTLARLLA